MNKKYAVTQHYVQFASPGTLFPETTEKEIDSWDVYKAVRMAHGITERLGATPYGFRFLTYGRTAKQLDSTVIKSSCFYFLGGKVETYEEICLRNDPKEETLRWNMKNNKHKRVLVNTNSWKVVLPIEKKDVILDFKPRRKKRKK